jgi:hypothetical protein
MHRIENRLHGGIRRTLAIGILDAQDELAAAPTRLQPAVQRVRAPPICRKPVGLGAKRVRTVMGSFRRV